MKYLELDYIGRLNWLKNKLEYLNEEYLNGCRYLKITTAEHIKALELLDEIDKSIKEYNNDDVETVVVSFDLFGAI